MERTRALAMGLLVAGLLVSTATAPAVGGRASHPCRGTMTRPANGTTAISVQGYNESGKQEAMIVGVGPRGRIRWVHHNGAKYGVVWSYDIDPMPNGDLFVTAAVDGGKTIVYEFDPRTQRRVWVKRFDISDTHDADLINDGTAIVVANMRNYDAESGVNRDRIFVYNRTLGRVTWQWNFTDHFPRDVGGDPYVAESDYTRDWTHVNDVDEIGPGRFLVSPKHLDQVFVVDRTTGAISLRLGSDDAYDTLKLQHNPDYLEGRNGTPTYVVADSGNDRVVEYARDGDGWTRTWTLGTGGGLYWPRDADRLPSGNTLVTDSKNDRVIEVTSTGRVVWEVAAPWLVYDAARLSVPGEHGGPTIREQNASGSYALRGSSGFTHRELVACHARLMSIHGRVNASGEG